MVRGSEKMLECFVRYIEKTSLDRGKCPWKVAIAERNSSYLMSIKLDPTYLKNHNDSFVLKSYIVLGMIIGNVYLLSEHFDIQVRNVSENISEDPLKTEVCIEIEEKIREINFFKSQSIIDKYIKQYASKTILANEHNNINDDDSQKLVFKAKDNSPQSWINLGKELIDLWGKFEDKEIKLYLTDANISIKVEKNKNQEGVFEKMQFDDPLELINSKYGNKQIKRFKNVSDK